MADLIGYCAGFIAMITFLPQVIKTVKTKKAEDISLTMLLLTLSANTLYIIYGIMLNLYPVIIMLCIMTCIVILQIGLTLKYSKSNHKEKE